jgi:predicted RNA polymerase sigma factor
VHGPAQALESLAPLDALPALRAYAPFFAVRGELLRQAGRRREAAMCFEQALACPCSEPQRRYFARLASRLQGVATAAAGR